MNSDANIHRRRRSASASSKAGATALAPLSAMEHGASLASRNHLQQSPSATPSYTGASGVCAYFLP